MRPLNWRQSTQCEQSYSQRCKCRCGGKFHGAYRVDDVRALDLNDPHFPGDQMRLEDALLEERSWRRRHRPNGVNTSAVQDR